MLQAIGQDAENEGLDFGNGFIPGGAIGDGAGDHRDLGDPAAVLFAVDFDFHEVSFGSIGMDVNGGPPSSRGCGTSEGFRVEGGRREGTTGESNASDNF